MTCDLIQSSLNQNNVWGCGGLVPRQLAIALVLSAKIMVKAWAGYLCASVGVPVPGPCPLPGWTSKTQDMFLSWKKYTLVFVAVGGAINVWRDQLFMFLRPMLRQSTSPVVSCSSISHLHPGPQSEQLWVVMHLDSVHGDVFTAYIVNLTVVCVVCVSS